MMNALHFCSGSKAELSGCFPAKEPLGFLKAGSKKEKEKKDSLRIKKWGRRPKVEVMYALSF